MEKIKRLIVVVCGYCIDFGWFIFKEKRIFLIRCIGIMSGCFVAGGRDSGLIRRYSSIDFPVIVRLIGLLAFREKVFEHLCDDISTLIKI